MLKKLYLKIKSYIMGIVNKLHQKKDDDTLSKKEVEFILTKLRSANYKGDEFEQFFHIMRKLSDHLKTLQ